MEEILSFYYDDNARNLHNMVDSILFKLKFDVDNEDFYSLANEIFVEVLNKYDNSQSFDVFLYSCLMNKFKSEMTRMNRKKRKTLIKLKEKDEKGNEIIIERIIQDDSLDRNITSDDGIPLSDGTTLGETIAGGFNMEREIFKEDEEEYSQKMLIYLSRLSNMQRDVLNMIVEGYMPDEIRQKLHITARQYADCNAAIHSYRNIYALF
ncbi:MAG: hypothetical protein J1D87_04185 [Lachnospiraceae bacterium]|nr:hypothetical protein [Lachnospiraceae bacterium]